jgi:hypothetical protein
MHTKTNINFAAMRLAHGLGAVQAKRLKEADVQGAAYMSAAWRLEGGAVDGWSVTLACSKVHVEPRAPWAAEVVIESSCGGDAALKGRFVVLPDGGSDGKVACMRARAAFYQWACQADVGQALRTNTQGVAALGPDAARTVQ